MVEINNQRKGAFLDMLAWSEGTDNGRQKTRNHGYDVIVGGELFTDYSDHPRKLVTLNPKCPNQQAPDATSFFPLVGCLPPAVYPKDFSPKSQDAVALQQIKERGAYLAIDRGGYPAAGNRPLHIWASLPGAGYGRLSIRLTARLQTGRSGAERSERLREQSHRDYLRSGYLHHRSPVMGC